MGATGFVDAPIFALQEFIYGQGGVPTGWAAQRALARHPRFAAGADPLLFSGTRTCRW